MNGIHGGRGPLLLQLPYGAYTYSNTLSAASRIFTIRKDRLQSLTSISILCQDGFLSCGRAIR